MPSVETAYKKKTGRHPRKDFDPPLIGVALQRAYNRLKNPQPGIEVFNAPSVEEAVLYNHGLQADEPFTVIVAKFSDKTIQAAYLLRPPPNKDTPLVEFAKNSIPPNYWFPFDPENPSGV